MPKVDVLYDTFATERREYEKTEDAMRFAQQKLRELDVLEVQIDGKKYGRPARKSKTS